MHQQLLTTIQGLLEDSRIEMIEAKFHVIWVRDQRFAVGELFHHYDDDHAAEVLAWFGGAA